MRLNRLELLVCTVLFDELNVLLIAKEIVRMKEEGTISAK